MLPTSKAIVPRLRVSTPVLQGEYTDDVVGSNPVYDGIREPVEMHTSGPLGPWSTQPRELRDQVTRSFASRIKSRPSSRDSSS